MCVSVYSVYCTINAQTNNHGPSSRDTRGGFSGKPRWIRWFSEQSDRRLDVGKGGKRCSKLS
jgi:hypothetical protein